MRLRGLKFQVEVGVARKVNHHSVVLTAATASNSMTNKLLANLILSNEVRLRGLKF